MNIKEFYDQINGDFEDVLKRLANEVIVTKIVKMFVSDPSYNDITTGLENKDVELAFRGAHTLKGVALNLGFTSLAKDSSDLCELLRPRSLDVDYKELYDKVSKEYKELIEKIKEID